MDPEKFGEIAADSAREVLRYKRRANVAIAAIALVALLAVIAVAVSLRTAGDVGDVEDKIARNEATIASDRALAAKGHSAANRALIKRTEIILCAVGRLASEGRNPDPQLMVVLALLRKIDCELVLRRAIKKASRPGGSGEPTPTGIGGSVVDDGGGTTGGGGGGGSRKRPPSGGETPAPTPAPAPTPPPPQSPGNSGICVTHPLLPVCIALNG